MVQNGTKLERMQDKHRRAIELRYEGKTYKEIAEILIVEFPDKPTRDDRVRKWFASGGILELEYIDFARKENERRRAFTLEEMKKISSKIPIAYNLLLTNAMKEAENGVVNDDLRKVLKDLAEIMGIVVPPNTDNDEDPVERYFRRKKAELDSKHEE